MPKISRRVLNVASLTLVALVFGVAAFCFYAPFRALVLVSAGKSPHCPLSGAMRSYKTNRTHFAVQAQIQQATRKVRKDPTLDLTLWETPNGPLWFPRDENPAFLLAEQSRQIYGDKSHGVQSGDIVFDCGAHAGVFTRQALELGAKKVVAVEPESINLEALRRNFAAEIEQGRVVVVAKGVWDKEGSLSFHVSETSSGMHKFEETGANPADKALPLTTIDKLVDELRLDRVDFIKMDIEGAERKALAGASKSLAKFRPRMAICTYHLQDDPVEVVAAVRRALPDYQVECGPCEDQYTRIVPQTYLFR
ncbi:MAG: FkbM family methyltransferase [Bryobacteraceae bacterium]